MGMPKRMARAAVLAALATATVSSAVVTYGVGAVAEGQGEVSTVDESTVVNTDLPLMAEDGNTWS